MWKDYKKHSRIFDWGRKIEKNGNLTTEELKTGSLLRIADSLEKMEQRYTEISQSIENYKDLEIENKKLKKTISGLKGYINKNRK